MHEYKVESIGELLYIILLWFIIDNFGRNHEVSHWAQDVLWTSDRRRI